MKPKKINLLLFILFSIFVSNGQNQINYDCYSVTENDNQENSVFDAYSALVCSFNDVKANQFVNDAFFPTSNSPLYTVRLNLHLLQYDDGSGNFQDNETDKAFLQQLVDRVNFIYANSQQPVCNGITVDNYIIDSRIRFRVDGIYFHPNSSTYPSNRNAYGLFIRYMA